MKHLLVDFTLPSEADRGRWRMQRYKNGLRCIVSVAFGNDVDFFITHSVASGFAAFLEGVIADRSVCFKSSTSSEEGTGYLFAWPRRIPPPVPPAAPGAEHLGDWLQKGAGVLKICAYSPGEGLAIADLEKEHLDEILAFIHEPPGASESPWPGY